MRATVSRERLAVAHAIAARGVAATTRATHEIHRHVRYATLANELVLAATDGVTSVTTRLSALVEEEGTTAVLPHPLGDVLRTLDDETVALRSGDEAYSLIVAGRRSVCTVRGQDPAAYPAIPTLPTDVLGTLSSRLFEAMTRQCVLAAATTGVRPIFTGVSMTLADDTLTFAAADGFRLSVRRARITPGHAAERPVSLIVPAAALAEFAAILPKEDTPVAFGVARDGTTIVFRAGPTEYATRLIAGEYIPYEQLIPQACMSRAIVLTADLRQALHTAGLFARASGNFMSLTTAPGVGAALGTLVIGAEAPETGAGSYPVDAVVEGVSITVSFNITYLTSVLGALAAAGVEHVAIEVESPVSPAVLRTLDGTDFVYILMPMKPPSATALPADTVDGETARGARASA